MRRWSHVLVSLVLVACRNAPDFGAPVTVVARNAANPTVAVDPRNGTVYVAWVQTEADSSTNAYLAAADRDGPFGAAVRLNDRPGEVMLATQNPAQVVVSANGTVYVGWVSNRAPAAATQVDISVRLVRSSDGGRTFSPSYSFTSDSTRRWPANMYFDLAVAPDNSLYVSWLDLHYYTDTLASRAAQHIADSIPVPESRVDFRVARSTDGGQSFTGPVIVDSSSCICCRTAIATGPGGEVQALWRHVFPGNVRDFVSARTGDGAASFSSPTRVHDDHWVLNGCPDIGPDVAVDGHHIIHAAWYTGAPNRQGLWYAASRDDGRTFGPPVAILTDRYVPPSEVKLAALGASAWVVWEDRRREPGQIRLARAGDARSTRLGAGEYPTIAAGAEVLAVAWSEDGAVRVRTARVKRDR